MTDNNHPTKQDYRAYLLPLGIIGLTLMFLNIGMYRLLVSSDQKETSPTVMSEPVVESATSTPSIIEVETNPVGIAGGPSLDLSDWHVFAGQWENEANGLVQRQPTSYDNGISYHQTLAQYQLESVIQHISGVGGGFLFNMPARDRKNGAHLVRYTDDGAGLFWGYFEEDGSFVGQGFAKTAAPEQERHRLTITNNGQTYRIQLDGVEIAAQIPLHNEQGYIGLTSSNSAVHFDELTLTALEGSVETSITATPQTTTLLDDLQSISGEWVQEGETIQQVNQTETDFLISTQLLASQYTLEVDITLPDDPTLADAGGGIIFQMPDPTGKQGASMVRFAEGGQQVFWGNFDENAVFAGQGSVMTELATGQPQKLTLVVTQQSYDIIVNDQPIANQIPHQQEQGWIGLVSYRGPVSFSNLRLSLGGVVQ
ncbi:hypothetical protein QUF63_11040 [Anaerolineales bacterium HSG25]|nr:hypothetical protein [Anaerolineales bacterium HSG25]